MYRPVYIQYSITNIYNYKQIMQTVNPDGINTMHITTLPLSK